MNQRRYPILFRTCEKREGIAFSSIHRYVESELLERGWGSDELDLSEGGFGE